MTKLILPRRELLKRVAVAAPAMLMPKLARATQLSVIRPNPVMSWPSGEPEGIGWKGTGAIGRSAVLFSVISIGTAATPNGNYRCLTAGDTLAISKGGGANSISGGINGAIGPFTFQSSVSDTSLRYAFTTSSSLGLGSGITFCTIVQPNGVWNNAVGKSIYTTSISGGSNTVSVNGSGQFGFNTNAASSSTVAMTWSDASFLLWSMNFDGTPTKVALGLNLRTGQLVSETSTFPSAFFQASSGTCSIGSGGFGHGGFMHSFLVAAGFVNEAQARQVALNPWAIWYPGLA